MKRPCGRTPAPCIHQPHGSIHPSPCTRARVSLSVSVCSSVCVCVSVCVCRCVSVCTVCRTTVLRYTAHRWWEEASHRSRFSSATRHAVHNCSWPSVRTIPAATSASFHTHTHLGGDPPVQLHTSSIQHPQSTACHRPVRAAIKATGVELVALTAVTPCQLVRYCVLVCVLVCVCVSVCVCVCVSVCTSGEEKPIPELWSPELDGGEEKWRRLQV